MDVATRSYAEEVLARMGEHYPRQKDLAYFDDAATRLAEQLTARGAGVVELEPGNASQIVLVVTDLDFGFVPTPPWIADYRALIMAPSASLGGRFCIAIPNFTPGRVAVLSPFLDEYTISEHLGLMSDDAPYVALVLLATFDLLGAE